MEPQRTQNCQSNPEEKEQRCRNNPPRLHTILQCYSSHKSLVLAHKQAYESIESRIASPEINPHAMANL